MALQFFHIYQTLLFREGFIDIFIPQFTRNCIFGSVEQSIHAPPWTLDRVKFNCKHGKLMSHKKILITLSFARSCRGSIKSICEAGEFPDNGYKNGQ
jgi:hypothetical protein